MSLNRIALALAVLAVSLAPMARADEARTARLQALKERLIALEGKLEGSTATIAAQRELLESRSVPAVSQGGALDSFLSNIEVGGHVTGSYTYAFENPTLNQDTPFGGATAATTQPLNQFNQNHNTFQFDGAKIEIGKPTQGPGTSGFQLDLLFGANSQILGSGAQAADTDVYIQEAYARYNYRGTDFTFGKFETLLGYEVLDSPSNHHVSHGILFTWAIPLVHTGILASGPLTEQWGWALGLTNGFNNVADLNENKGLLGQIRFNDGPLGASLQTYYGADRSRFNPAAAVPADIQFSTDESTSDALIVDFVATYAASDSLELWLNADWGQQEGVVDQFLAFQDFEWWGVAAGASMQLNEKTSFSLRGEFFTDEDGSRVPRSTLIPPLAIPPVVLEEPDVDIFSLTGTLGYALTDNLTTRLELRYDKVKRSGGILGGTAEELFPSGQCVVGVPACIGPHKNDAVTGYLEVSYSFD